MSGPPVTVDIDAKDSGAQSAWQRQEKAINGLIERLKKLEERSESVRKSQNNWVSSTINDIGSMVTGLATVASAVGLITKEYESLEAAKTKALTIQKGLAEAQRTAVMNLGEDKDFTAPKLIKAIGDIARETGVDETMLTNTISDALSARGDLTVQQTLDSARASARLAPTDAATQKTLASSAMDIGKASGATPESAIGFMQAVGAKSRVGKIEFLAENAAPAITGVAKFGGSEREAGALFSALSGGLVDPTGAQSKTTAISLADQLRKFLPKEKDTDDRIRKLQENAGLRKRFLEKAHFEAAAKPVVEGLLSGDKNSPERRAYEDALGGIPEITKGAPVFEKSLKDINALPAVQTAQAAGASTATAGRVLGGNTPAARSAAGKKAIEEMTEATGGGFFADQINKWGYWGRQKILGQTPEIAAANTLEAQSRAFERPVAAAYGPGGGAPVPATVSAEEREYATALRETATVWRRMADGIDKLNAKPPVVVKKDEVPGVHLSPLAGRGR